MNLSAFRTAIRTFNFLRFVRYHTHPKPKPKPKQQLDSSFFNIRSMPHSPPADGTTIVTPIPYWCVNVPQAEWPTECPEYLRNQSQKDQEQLATPDERYERPSWEEVKEIIDTNHIDRFRRLPSDLRAYRKYVYMLKQDYGSVMNFVLRHKLKWDLATSGDEPFTNEEDLKILPNDWPYGIDKDIVHLVVWTKFKFQEEPSTGDLTPESRTQIDDFVTKTFRSRMDAENVRWFKNWASLKSVHAVEHFHVMLYKPDGEFVREITGGAEKGFDTRALKAR